MQSHTFPQTNRFNMRHFHIHSRLMDYRSRPGHIRLSQTGPRFPFNMLHEVTISGLF